MSEETGYGVLHVLLGAVGAGKSTFARERALATCALFLDLDTWMVRLFGEDPRPKEGVLAWYLERRGRCREVMWSVACDALAGGVDVYLEFGLVRRQERSDFHAEVRARDLGFVVHLPEAPRDVRRERVMDPNVSGVPGVQVVPLEFFEMASDAWEPLSEEEREMWCLTPSASTPA